MQSQLFLALALVGLSAAQSTTVSLFLPNTDQQGLVASVLGADATATTYALSCPLGTDASSCGYGGGATVIEGPSTLQLILLSSSVPLETIACNLAGTTQAVCTISETLKGYSTSQVTTSTLGPADITFFPISITAGAEKLGAASSGGSATASRTGGGPISASSTTAGPVGSLSTAASSTSGRTASVTGAASGTAASHSVSATTTMSSMSQTQAASSAASGKSNSALRTNKVQSPLLGMSVSCIFAGALAAIFL